MTDADFLQEILANPDDDAPRLIFADWLDERSELDVRSNDVDEEQ